MIFNEERIDILDHSEALIQMIQHSDFGVQYRNTKIALHNDEEAQEIKREFVKWKERFEEVQRFGRYHPDYKEVNAKMRDVKRRLDLNDTVIAFKKAEKELEKLLNEIAVRIGQTVSPSIKVPTGNPFFDTGGGCATGGCSTGGGCGCSSKK